MSSLKRKKKKEHERNESECSESTISDATFEDVFGRSSFDGDDDASSCDNEGFEFS
eukprot:CAMPEP_0203802942 /NCGR_PEP_ID=MMETSP0100_2-20121128/12467_1 /ASSEMBLY_ACC=CAM_ASM_000210 /TAXON_ID=96639 /ORGANISM=" , Strain NY0313808BC1" /LENGTH=55 /DNA_ID=CAMNT_0050710421 /DNA_START=14 /DNA_END=177 /DNA_ORIENTATION=-